MIDKTTKITSKQAEDIEKHNIQLVSVDTYHVGPYRYSNLADAIAQAKQIARRNPSP